MLSILTSSWAKYAAIIAAVVAILFGTYEFGSSHGYSKGYKTAWDAQQKALDKMATEQNAEISAQNQKITALEKSATDAMQQLAEAKKAVQTKRDAVVVEYKKANPKVAEAPAWSPETVDAINKMIGAQ